jgi:hypothetical protein
MPQDFRNRSMDRGTSGFDIKHRLVQGLNYELPVGSGKKWSLGNRLGNAVFGNWQMNTIFTSQTGLPFTPVLQTAVSNAGSSRPDRLGSGELAAKDPAHWFDTSFNTPGAAWGIPQQFTYGNAGRNILRGPGRINLDFSLFKDFPITERLRLELRSEFFNVMNTPAFGLPNATI